MKKLTILAVTALLCFSFTACGSSTTESQPAEEESVSQTSQEETSQSAEIISTADSTDAIQTEKEESLPPQIQDIRKFLALDTPYDTEMGTYGSMDFIYSLEHGEEELMQQFIDTLIIGGYGLNLVDIYEYDYESAYYKSYSFIYRGKGEDKLQRENMDWDVSVGITTHKDSNEVTAGVFYVNGF